MSKPFSHSFRVRYSEVDNQGVVFNSRYLEYADVVITEFWREIGLQSTDAGSLEFHVVRAQVEFRMPIRPDEMIEGRARTARLGNSSVTTIIDLHGPGGDADLRARIELVHVNVDLASGQSQVLPAAAREVLAVSMADS